MNYKPHELAALFPRADSTDTQRIQDDIRKNGCRVPIVLYEGQILDGLTRYETCRRYGKKPLFRAFTGTREEAISHVTSLNLCRRHLTQAQKAEVARQLKNLLEASGASPREALSAASREAKVSEDSVRRMERVAEINEFVAKQVLDGQMSIAQAEEEIDPSTDAELAREEVLSSIAALRRAKLHLIDAPEEIELRLDRAIQQAEKALKSKWFD